MSDNWPGVSPQTSVGDPFFALRDLHRSFFPEEISNPLSELSESSAGPFNSGLVGGFGYGLAHAIENLTDTGIDDLNLPDMVFMVVDEVMAFNHHTGQAFLTIVGRGCNQTEAHEQATINRSHFLDRLRDFESTKKPDIISPQTIDTLAQSLNLLPHGIFRLTHQLKPSPCRYRRTLVAQLMPLLYKSAVITFFVVMFLRFASLTA